MYVCICNAVTDSDIRSAVRRGARNFKQLKRETGCSNVCGSCKADATEVLDRALAEKREIPNFVQILQTG